MAHEPTQPRAAAAPRVVMTDDPATFSPERIKGEWTQLKKRAKQVWADLSDYDFTKADGSADKLYAMIEKRFNITLAEVKAKLDALRRT